MAKGRSNRAAKTANGGANLGFETKRWAAADALRNNMDAAEYKHVVLGLIVLKYIYDAIRRRARQARHPEGKPRRPRGSGRVSRGPQIYALVNVCRALDIDPYAYLSDVLDRASPHASLAKLTPWG